MHVRYVLRNFLRRFQVSSCLKRNPNNYFYIIIFPILYENGALIKCRNFYFFYFFFYFIFFWLSFKILKLTFEMFLMLSLSPNTISKSADASSIVRYKHLRIAFAYQKTFLLVSSTLGSFLFYFDNR